MGELPEQVPYLEWAHSEYRDSRSCQGCHMPQLEEERSDQLGAGRAATGPLEARLPRRERVHATDPEQVPGAAERRGATPGGGCGAGPDGEVPGGFGGRDLAGVRARDRIEPGGGCLDRQPGRTQAADGLSVPTRLAACHGPGRGGRRHLRVGRAPPGRCDHRQRQRRGLDPVRAALHTDRAARPGPDLRADHGGLERGGHHRAALRRPLYQGQPAVAARVRCRDGRRGHRGSGAGRGRRRLPRRR